MKAVYFENVSHNFAKHDVSLRPSVEQCRRWQESLENVLHDPSKLLSHFLHLDKCLVYMTQLSCCHNFYTLINL